ncbi:hypothetical protein BS50DRAFT_562877 [Corynespora cassiicola Philippines]|uniref:Rhodopsin domain-containing protein n=1 Tax=Corynespora cassiicola Philippines TaxID=1448308 RepID=A0A2T2N658_CORCC|nr:hypothetical protein BS50DRAFT_562877 [Corynespora cassiicola Philippines]
MRDNKTNDVQILTWFLFCVGLFSAVARIGTRYAMTRKHKQDDMIILIGLVPYLAQTIVVSIAASNGLGKTKSELTQDQILRVMKAEYSAVPLFILTLTIVKASILVFVWHLSPGKLHRRLEYALRIIIFGWAFIAINLSLFQCAMPEPWNHIKRNKCADIKAWWTFVTVVNALTDVSTVTLQLLIVWSVQISYSKKLLLSSLFGTRLIVVAPTVAQLETFWHATQAEDFTYVYRIPVILSQTTLALSFVTACIPYLKPFMESLESGVIHIPDVGEQLHDEDRSALNLDNWGSSSNSGARTLAGSFTSSGLPSGNKIRQTKSWAVDVRGSRR